MEYICLPTMLIATRTTILGISLSLSLTSAAQQKPSPLSPYVKEDAPVLVLEHVRLIDGTGSAPQEDMRIDIAGGKITAFQAASAHNPYPPNAKVEWVIVRPVVLIDKPAKDALRQVRQHESRHSFRFPLTIAPTACFVQRQMNQTGSKKL